MINVSALRGGAFNLRRERRRRRDTMTFHRRKGSKGHVRDRHPGRVAPALLDITGCIFIARSSVLPLHRTYGYGYSSP